MTQKGVRDFIYEMSFQLNLRFFLLYCMIVLNLLIMHYYIALEIGLEDYPGCRVTSNIWACVVDATVIYLISYALTLGRVRTSLLLAFFLSLILSYSNILYARFFGIYLPKNILSQVGNLYDKDVLLSVCSSMSLFDGLYLVLASFFCSLLFKWKNTVLQKKSFRTLLFSICAVYSYFVIWLFLHIGNGKYYQNFKDGFYDLVPYAKWESAVKPNIYLFKMGFVRRFIYCFDDYTNKHTELTPNQIDEITKYYSDHTQRVSNRQLLKSKNIIFILVESFLSATSDLFVDGQEITPFLNKLKTEKDVCYNAHVQSNISSGQSSDGQLIYMTGLLPIKSIITVDIAKRCHLKGLPKLMKEYGVIKEAHIIIPTTSTFWAQDEMCKVYGIDTIYSKADAKEGTDMFSDLNDEKIFSMASAVDCKASHPFFSLILTMTMHGPYNLKPASDFALTDNSIPEEYKNYLIKCHYSDEQIERYIKSLKESGVYDESVIVIASDHHINPKFLNMEGRLSTDLPLFIINGDIDANNFWTGACNQLDVYTTLLDLLIRDKWCGLGHTLLQSEYNDSNTPQAQKVSEWIIRGDFFDL